MGNIINQREVSIDVEGRKVTGVYTVWSGVITVSSKLGRKATQVGASESLTALEGLARMILRELAQDATT